MFNLISVFIPSPEESPSPSLNVSTGERKIRKQDTHCVFSLFQSVFSLFQSVFSLFQSEFSLFQSVFSLFQSVCTMCVAAVARLSGHVMPDGHQKLCRCQ